MAALSGNEQLRVFGVSAAGSPSGQDFLTSTQSVAALAGSVSSVAVLTTISTVGNGTITAAGLVGRVISRTGTQVGAISDTTATAAQIAAALPAGVTYPVSWDVVILNNTAPSAPAQDTISGGTGVTFSGKVNATPALVLAPNCLARILVTMTSTTACTMYVQSIEDIGIDNFNAATDPTTANDNTQGFGPGSQWLNTTAGALRLWTCRSAATGAAAWAFDGADYANGGTNPNTEQTAFGGGAATIPAEGNVNRQISSAGVQPGATGADNVLAVYSLPAGSFDQANRGLQITAAGSFGSTGNNKRIKIIFNPSTAVVGSTVGAGGTTIADTGTVATNGGGWEVAANVFKYGAAASNTQIGIHSQAQIGAAVAALLAPSLITATESGAILIAITGNATTAASDIVFNWLEVNAMN